MKTVHNHDLGRVLCEHLGLTGVSKLSIVFDADAPPKVIVEQYVNNATVIAHKISEYTLTKAEPEERKPKAWIRNYNGRQLLCSDEEMKIRNDAGLFPDNWTPLYE